MLDLALPFLVLLAGPPADLHPAKSQARWQERYTRAMGKLQNARKHAGRGHALDDAAKAAFELGRLDEAREHALELLDHGQRWAPRHVHGFAIHDAHMVLGRLALKDGNVEQAKRELLLAGRAPGSPTTISFGPNMSLAKDLLEQGQVDVVIEYFRLCASFWKLERGRLDRWSEMARAGDIPDFGPNLVY